MLDIKDIHVYYDGIHAIKGVSMTVPQGSLVTLVGSNGAGKTTLLRTICGLKKPSQGSINFKGENLLDKSATGIVQMGISMVPEGRQIFPDLTVLENLHLGAFRRNDTDGIKRDMDWVFQLFPRLKERIHQKGGTLSGGEQQMLAIGRGLMSRPSLLLLDEPSLGLAPILVEEVFSIIQEIHSQGVTLLLIEQNAHAALSIADYGYVMESGAIALEGKGQDLLYDEAVRRAYLGGEAVK
ncbi:MAG: ABC transporter ATP-binding protein [Bacillota bacterium]|nr:ABC transporter ATP-binding protein [Bacillota bacterium]MDI9415193.1 ABC transporter ATP-binding protein [Bacillota bacterium]HOB88757.1 ABC transporter ATP-binding protein [Bacillota bacterium]HPO81170.1 ABC transporter ATP-binding protein [Bacillota bacterium]HPU61266.1 ABC transporter ATP-binding protein [Bacillota bacterium]